MTDDRDDDDDRGATAPGARARTVEHMRTLLAGATASIALAGCSSSDAGKHDAGGSAAPLPSVAEPPAPSSADAVSPGASSSPALLDGGVDAGGVDGGIVDAGMVDGGSVDAGRPDAGRPVVKHPQRRPSGYEVVDMLPPPPFFFRRRREKKKKDA